MKRVVGGSLMLTMAVAVSGISAATAGAAPRRSAGISTQTVSCYGGPGVGPITVTEQTNTWTDTIGDTTLEVGTVRLINVSNGHSHVFPEIGAVTDLGPTSTGFGASDDFVLRGALIWASRDDLSYVVGTATTNGGTFDQITGHTGSLTEACESVA